MNYCSTCRNEVPEEVCRVPRLPCPFCEGTGRFYTRVMHETVHVADSVSWTQMRSVLGGSATLDDKNQIRFKATGRPPRNEEDALKVCARLVGHLNAQGANWSDPVEGVNDVDACSADRGDPSRKRQMQVVRASNNEEMWRTLSRESVVEIALDSAKAADELITAVRNKSAKYPDVQRRALTLVIDTGRTPGHSFRQVYDVFRRVHLEACRSFGFAEVWLVGSVDELVLRLDV